MTGFRALELRIGRARPFGPQGQPSATDKQPVSGPLMAEAHGFAGDAQGDRKRHGGADKAIHAYSIHHYPAWAADLPAAASRFRPGGFGENLVIDGAREDDICLGDLWQLGDALLQVSQGRQPCWKLNLRFGIADMARQVQSSGRTGWYFRVCRPSLIAPGQTACLLTRPNPDWPLDRVNRLLYRRTLDVGALAELAELPGLPESWRKLALNRLASGRVEDWKPRLQTPLAESGTIAGLME